MSVSLASVISGPSITVYGNPISDLQFSADQAQEARLGVQGKPKEFANIVAFRLGGGTCVKLPVPVLMIVNGEKEELNASECGLSPGQVYKWQYEIGEDIVAFEPSRGKAEEVLETLVGRGIDGGIEFENPRFENGRVSATVRVWAKITILGRTARFDERFPVSVNVGAPCIKVWENGFANLQVCYRAPNQICGKLCAGKWGLEKCWEKCVAVPIGYASQSFPSVSTPCDCHSNDAATQAFAREFAACISVTIDNGKACLNVPIFGDVCIDIPSIIPSGTVAEACIDICKQWGVPCGVKVTVSALGSNIATKEFGCC